MKIKLIIPLLIFSSFLYSQPVFDIQGHRGCRGLYPENTIVAFIEAVKLGVNTLEMDIVVSKDSQILISHDPYMSETICLGPDGKHFTGTERENYKIYNLTYSEIKKFDCGSSGNPRFPEQKKVAVYKPLLSDVIDTVERYIKEHHLPPVYYNIETKSTKKGDGIYHPKPYLFTKMFYDMIKQKGIEKRCILQSFDVRTLQEMKKINSTITTALLVENIDGLEKNLQKLGFNPNIYSPDYHLVTKNLIQKCHQMHIKVLPWTVDEIKPMLKLKKMGVDGIISDYPNVAIKVLR